MRGRLRPTAVVATVRLDLARASGRLERPDPALTELEAALQLAKQVLHAGPDRPGGP